MRPMHRLSFVLLSVHLACSSSSPSAMGPADAGTGAMLPPDAAVTPDAMVEPDTGADLAPDGPSLQAAAKAHSPLPELPKNPTNKYADNAAAATLGQRLFFETGYSGALSVGNDGANGGLGSMGEAGKISCASCHLGAGLSDTRSRPGSVSLGAGYLGRNALGLVNASYYKWVNWAGRFSAQWELPMAVAENPNNMNSTRLRIAHLIFDKYRADYEAAFGPLDAAIGADPVRFPAAGKPKAAMAADGPWEMMAPADRQVVTAVFVNFGKALEAYMRRLVSKGSRFDDFVGGNEAAINASEQRGLAVFLGKGQCAQCHGGPNFSDDDFHNLGVPQTGDHVPAMDLGRFTDIPPLLASPLNSAGESSDDRTTGRLAGLNNPPPDTTKGQFRTPSLRNVAATGPYMHAGQFASLAQVIEFYDQGGGTPAAGSTKDSRLHPLGLSAEEKADLAAFLGTLDSPALPPALLEDTSRK